MKAGNEDNYEEDDHRQVGEPFDNKLAAELLNWTE